MQILGHGIDLIETDRIREMIERHGDHFLNRVFTPAEQAYALASRNRAHEHLAARFAAKEAVLKAIGSGWRNGIAWTDVEVIRQPSGRPTVRIRGIAADLAAKAGITDWQISLTHTGAHAMASAIALGQS